MIYQYNECKELKGNNLYKKYKHDAGWDIKSPRRFKVTPKESYILATGLHILIPKGLKGIIQSRSGLSMSFSLEVGNAGVIDYGYKGDCNIKIYNNSNDPFIFNKGDRIAQIVFDTSLTVSKLEMIKLYWNLFWKGIPQVIPEVPIEEWPKTDRETNGIGSTGIN